MPELTPIAAMFDRTADTYDQVGVDLFGPVADLLVRELDPRPDDRALDVGCGRGAALVRLGRATGSTVVGIDLAPRMVEAARAEAAAAGVDAVVTVGDAQQPEVGDARFDVVASSLVVFFLPDPLAALRRWRDLLVPGGRLGVTTFGPTCAMWRAVDEVFEPYLPPAVREGRARALEGPFQTDEGVEGLLAEAGLADVRTVGEVVSASLDDEQHWLRWSWSAGHRVLWESVPEEHHDEIRQRAFEVLQDFRGDDGRIGFEQPVRATLGRNPVR